MVVNRILESLESNYKSHHDYFECQNEAAYVATREILESINKFREECISLDRLGQLISGHYHIDYSPFSEIDWTEEQAKIEYAISLDRLKLAKLISNQTSEDLA